MGDAEASSMAKLWSNLSTFQGQLSISQCHKNGSEAGVEEISRKVKSICVCFKTIQPNSIIISYFDHNLDKPKVKRPNLGNKG